jgi:hypothetical protein
MLLMASNRKKFGRMGAVKRKEIELELRARIEMELRAEVEADVRKRLLPAVAFGRGSARGADEGAHAFRGREARGGGGSGPAGPEEGPA